MDKQDRLIEMLIQRNIFKLEDGRDLYEGSSEELARLLKGAEEMQPIEHGTFEVTQLLAGLKRK